MMFSRWDEKVLRLCSMLLLIADVGENMIEDRQLPVGRRYVQPTLKHQTKRPIVLGGDRLASLY